MAESLCEELGKEILNLSEDIAKKKIDKAQYDKSYNAVILGVNQNFVDDVPEKEKTELISKHSIPKTADNGKYYAFKINGVYYVKKSNTDFKLYEDVVIRVPNGNWNNMFIEVQRDTVGSSGEPTPTFDFGKVSFDKNRLYYNGETYHLQFGINKRIMCVTKGNKYALINSYDYTESRIEAATAVMNGLTEDWDLEFDLFSNQCDISWVIDYSGTVKCDWGDGIINNEKNHSYSTKDKYTVKIKLLSGVEGEITRIGTFVTWDVSENILFRKQGVGQRFYIGGSIKNISFNGWQNTVNCVSFGESVKSIRGSRPPYDARLNKPYELGIPPFIEYIGEWSYIYNASDYLYIPESCTEIGRLAFYYNGAREIEIESNGGQLNLGNGAFYMSYNEYGGFGTDVVRFPARAKINSKTGENIFENNGLGALYIENGVTDIDYKICYGADKGGFSNLNSNKPYFIFIPKSVENIGWGLVSTARPTYIICSGKWSDIIKDEGWNQSPTENNVHIMSNSSFYSLADKIIDRFVRRS